MRSSSNRYSRAIFLEQTAKFYVLRQKLYFLHLIEIIIMLQSGDTVPNFRQQSSQGKIDFYDWAGDSWIVFFSYPVDCTSICTAELGSVAKLKPEFDKRGVKVIALSVKNQECQQDLIDEIDEAQDTTVNYPVVADADKSVSALYDIINSEANGKVIVRTVFVIDPQKKLRLTISDPPNMGGDLEINTQRNFQDVLRTIDSLQSSEN